MPARKHHTEATGGPASEMQKHCSCCLMTLKASLLLCHLILIDMAVLFSAVELKEASLKKWTPLRVRNTRHQPMSAMVSICVLYFHTLFGAYCLPTVSTTLGCCFFPEMAYLDATVTVQRHTWSAELQTKATAT